MFDFVRSDIMAYIQRSSKAAKGLLLVVIILTLIALLLSGCSPKDPVEDNSNQEATTPITNTEEETEDTADGEDEEPVDLEAAANDAFAAYVLDYVKQMAADV